MFKRRATAVFGVIFALLPSCAQGRNCGVDKSCVNQLTFKLDLEALPTGSYQLKLTDLSPTQEDLICDFELDANERRVNVEWTGDCPWTRFSGNELQQAKLTLPINPRTVTIKFLHIEEELFAETGLSPEYKFGDGCNICRYTVVDINPTFVE